MARTVRTSTASAPRRRSEPARRNAHAASRRAQGAPRVLAATGAMEAALRLLEYRARSRQELEQRLRRRGAPPDVIEQVLARLAQQGYVNDEQFAKQWAESRVRTGHGKRRIAVELRAKGIGTQTIRDTLSATAGQQEFDAAWRLVSQRARAWRGLEPATIRRRLYGLLQRRGYTNDVIERVLTRIAPNDDVA